MNKGTSRVLHRSLRETPLKAIGGEGIYLFAEDAGASSMHPEGRRSPASATSIRA